VLNVLPFPLSPRFGGVALQLAARLAAESSTRPVALLTFDRACWRVEVEDPFGRRAATGALARPLAGEASSEEPVETIERVAAALGTSIIHLENLEALPLASLATFAERHEVVLSTHDFALYCPRVHLLEQPSERFCNFCSDLERCSACLGSGDPRYAIDPSARRADAARLVAAAKALVHPSRFMSRLHAQLLGTGNGIEQVIPPAIAIQPPRRPRTPQVPPRRIAFFGQASVRKGVWDYARAVQRVAPGAPGVEWMALGGGEPDIISGLRRSGILVLGAYSAGDGARALVRHRVDLAVLPSRFPEAHCLALDECITAGVQVIAPNTGALGERVRDLHAGVTFGNEPHALESALREGLLAPLAAAIAPHAANSVTRGAVAHVELYSRLRESTSGRSRSGGPPA